MTPAEIQQVAEWLVDHGFTVYVDYENSRITLDLGLT